MCSQLSRGKKRELPSVNNHQLRAGSGNSTLSKCTNGTEPDLKFGRFSSSSRDIWIPGQPSASSQLLNSGVDSSLGNLQSPILPPADLQFSGGDGNRGRKRGPPKGATPREASSTFGALIAAEGGSLRMKPRGAKAKAPPGLSARWGRSHALPLRAPLPLPTLSALPVVAPITGGQIAVVLTFCILG